MKALIGAFNQEKALAGAFSVITNLRMELFEALILIWFLLVFRPRIISMTNGPLSVKFIGKIIPSCLRIPSQPTFLQRKINIVWMDSEIMSFNVIHWSCQEIVPPYFRQYLCSNVLHCFTTSPNPSCSVHLISDETVQKLTSYSLSTKLESTGSIILFQTKSPLWSIMNELANEV